MFWKRVTAYEILPEFARDVMPRRGGLRLYYPYCDKVSAGFAGHRKFVTYSLQ